MAPPATGAFTLSLDFELMWGTRDTKGEAFRRQYEVERSDVIDRLLSLLAAYEVPATWCTLGHLFLDRCTEREGRKHPEIVPPRHAWVEGDWFAHDPCTNEKDDPLWYGRSLLARVRECPTPQEIGCHSFSHAIFGDSGCSRETAESELRACVAQAERLGLTLRSFAFPRNRVGHLEVLRQHGIQCYRGPEPTWYERPRAPSNLKRAAHLFDVIVARTPPVNQPVERLRDLWDIPGSMIFFPSHGWRRHLPMALRIRRAIKGLDRAESERRIFHLWLHPTNLADRTDAMFDGLEQVLADAARRRSRGALRIAPMSELIPTAPQPVQ
jgi:peptidoglycan/xylan/chitin deacetylase (PgdA/CDA1 family)